MPDVTRPNKFDLGSDYRLVRAKINLNFEKERSKLINPQRFTTSDELKQNKTPIMIINELENKIQQDIQTIVRKTTLLENKQNANYHNRLEI